MSWKRGAAIGAASLGMALSPLVLERAEGQPASTYLSPTELRRVATHLLDAMVAQSKADHAHLTACIKTARNAGACRFTLTLPPAALCNGKILVNVSSVGGFRTVVSHTAAVRCS